MNNPQPVSRALIEANNRIAQRDDGKDTTSNRTSTAVAMVLPMHTNTAYSYGNSSALTTPRLNLNPADEQFKQMILQGSALVSMQGLTQARELLDTLFTQRQRQEQMQLAAQIMDDIERLPGLFKQKNYVECENILKQVLLVNPEFNLDSFIEEVKEFLKKEYKAMEIEPFKKLLGSFRPKDISDLVMKLSSENDLTMVQVLRNFPHVESLEVAIARTVVLAKYLDQYGQAIQNQGSMSQCILETGPITFLTHNEIGTYRNYTNDRNKIIRRIPELNFRTLELLLNATFKNLPLSPDVEKILKDLIQKDPPKREVIDRYLNTCDQTDCKARLQKEITKYSSY